MIRVGIVEDNIFLLKSFRDFLNNSEGVEVGFSYSSMEEARLKLLNSKIEKLDIILLDIFLPGESGTDGIQFFKKQFPLAKIIMLTAYNEESLIIQCLKLGASGYALKNAQLSHLLQIINQAIRSGSYIDELALTKLINNLQKITTSNINELITHREKEIVALVAKGCSYKQMSEKLFVTTFTINYHLKNIYKKLNINSKSQLLSKIMEESNS